MAPPSRVVGVPLMVRPLTCIKVRGLGVPLTATSLPLFLPCLRGRWLARDSDLHRLRGLWLAVDSDLDRLRGRWLALDSDLDRPRGRWLAKDSEFGSRNMIAWRRHREAGDCDG